MSAIAERVTAGAAFLDEHDPQWWRADVQAALRLDGRRDPHDYDDLTAEWKRVITGRRAAP